MATTKSKPKVPVVDISLMDKVMPNSITEEKSVLGILMSENHHLDEVCEILKSPTFFYLAANQSVFEAILHLRDRSCRFDIITVCNILKTKGQLDDVGGPLYVTSLTNFGSSAMIQSYALIVAESYMKRQLIKLGGNIVHKAYSDEQDVFELIDYAEGEIMAINLEEKKTYEKLEDGVFDVMKHIESLRHSDEELTGVTSGFPAIDRLTCGWQQPDLIVLAARPSVGKTAFALNLARNAAKDFVRKFNLLFPQKAPPGKKPEGVGFFSLEMSKAQLIQRLLSIESKMDLSKISRGKLDDHEMKTLTYEGFEKLLKVPIFIDDTPALNIFELRAKARRMKSKDNVGIIIIDYLQLMSGISGERNENREQTISKISRDLKGLAKELQIPIIALAQLSREVEKRTGKDGVKMPVLSDLRESGAIEQDADVVMFMYRPEYYGITANAEGQHNNGDTKIKFAKHRNGALDEISVRAELRNQTFHNYDSTVQTLDFSKKVVDDTQWKPIQQDVFND